MSRTHVTQCIARILAIVFIASNQVSAQENTAADMPQPPSPTDAQLTLGHKLLEKITYVIQNVPLQDAVAVMRVFGFSDLYTWVYPTYVRLGPINRTTHVERPPYLAGTGFNSLSVDPIVRSEIVNHSAGLNARFNPKEACITVDAVRERFGDAKNVRLSTRFISDSGPNPERVTNTDAISFEPLNTPKGMIGSIGFTFGYQTCANQFGFIYKTMEDKR